MEQLISFAAEIRLQLAGIEGISRKHTEALDHAFEVAKHLQDMLEALDKMTKPR